MVEERCYSSLQQVSLRALISLLGCGQLTNLIQISHIDGNRNIGGVTIIEEVFQPNLHRDGADHFAEAWHLQVLHFPDFEHQGTELLTNEAHPVLAHVNSIEVTLVQLVANWIVGRGKVINEVK